MTDTGAPVVIRRGPESPYTNRPGVHSRNRLRTRPAQNHRSSLLRFIQILLLVAGVGATGYYGYVLSNQYVYQAFENWAFDQQIAGRPAVTFADYVREQTPFGFLAGSKTASPASSVAKPAPAPKPLETPRPAQGALLGRVEIARLNLAAIVREGVDAKTLGVAVGHVPSTSLPGQEGNFAIAAHRDTLFRALKDIKDGDLITFQSAAGTYTYQVAATKIVKPSDVSVLRADGGRIISGIDPPGQAPGRLLTMITCYPFYYVGSAPKRFIVEAKLISNDATAKLSETTVQVPLPTAVAAAPKPRAVRPAAPSADAHSARFSGWQNSRKAGKKRGFWHSIFHFRNK